MQSPHRSSADAVIGSLAGYRTPREHFIGMHKKMREKLQNKHFEHVNGMGGNWLFFFFFFENFVELLGISPKKMESKEGNLDEVCFSRTHHGWEM